MALLVPGAASSISIVSNPKNEEESATLVIVSEHVPSRLLLSRWECKSAVMYVSFLSEWKVLLFNDIRDAIKFKQFKDTHYLCVSNVERLNGLGWCIPPSINPDMTRVVSSIDAATNYALTSQSFTNAKDTTAIKIFVEYYQRDAKHGGGRTCHPLTLSDRELPLVLEQLMVMPECTFLDGSSASTHAEDDDSYYSIDNKCIVQGLEHRTTVMLRNIPNKYTQAMIIDMLNECHWGEYDFVYLRMDFKNRCNVGYAFINFTHPMHVLNLVQRICRVTFARIQGREALIDKFRGSKVMLESPKFRPKLFYTEGHLRGREEPFPV